jgi:integrase/recombinase XerD
MTTLIEGCVRLRDRFLLSLLRSTGRRIGEALGLRHEDVDAHADWWWCGHDRMSMGRGPRRRHVRFPPMLSCSVCTAITCMTNIGSLDCDYVFVNLWGRRSVSR